MIWPFRKRETKPEPWTPGRVIDLFRDFEPPEGVAVTASLPVGLDQVMVVAGRVAFGRADTEDYPLCTCPKCLAGGRDYPGEVRMIKFLIARRFPPDDIAFTVSAPAAAEAEAN